MTALRAQVSTWEREGAGKATPRTHTKMTTVGLSTRMMTCRRKSAEFTTARWLGRFLFSAQDGDLRGPTETADISSQNTRVART